MPPKRAKRGDTRSVKSQKRRRLGSPEEEELLPPEHNAKSSEEPKDHDELICDRSKPRSTKSRKYEEAKQLALKLSNLCGRFQHDRVEVEKWESKYWIAHLINEEGSTKRYTFKMTTNRGYVVPQLYKEKWRKREEKGSGERLNGVLNALKYAVKSLTYDPDSQTWSDDAEKDLEGTTVTTQHSESGEENDEEFAEEEKALFNAFKDKKFTVKRMKQIMDAVTGSKLKRELVKALLVAYKAKMHSSKGHQYVTCLLEAACYACFGEKFDRYIQVCGVGTGKSSNFHREGFPVSEVKATAMPEHEILSHENASTNPDPQEHVESWVSSNPPVLDPAASAPVPDAVASNPILSPTSPAVSSSAIMSTDHSICSTASSARSQDGYIYTDIFAASVLGDFKKYLLVVEIKSTLCFSAKDMLQLTRQMLGAGIHQTEVFGLILNCKGAKLLKMTVDKHNKKIITVENEYCFMAPLIDSMPRRFVIQDDQLCEFFEDIVALLDYACANIAPIKQE